MTTREGQKNNKRIILDSERKEKQSESGAGGYVQLVLDVPVGHAVGPGSDEIVVIVEGSH